MKKIKQTNHWSDDSIVPAETSSYCPVKHTDLIATITFSLNSYGYRVLSNTVTQAKNGQEIVGHMVVSKPIEDDSSEFTMMFAYMNSYNKHLPIKLASGAHVFICSNGMVVGEILSYRKHTKGLDADLIALIDECTSGLSLAYNRALQFAKTLQAFKVARKIQAEILGRLYIDKHAITSSELNVAINQLDEPSFQQFSDNNLWSLYNHITFALKNAVPSRRLRALRAVHQFFVEFLWDEYSLDINTN